jgi:hypothetical protein
MGGTTRHGLKENTVIVAGMVAVVVVLLVATALFFVQGSIVGSEVYAQGCEWSGTTCYANDVDGYLNPGDKATVLIGSEDGYALLDITESDYDPDDDRGNRKLWRILYQRYGVDNPAVGWYDACSRSGPVEDGTVAMSSLTDENKDVLAANGWTRVEPHTECEDTQYEKQFEGGYHKDRMSQTDLDLLFRNGSCSFEGIEGKLTVAKNSVACVVKNTKDYDIDCDDRCNAQFAFENEPPEKTVYTVENELCVERTIEQWTTLKPEYGSLSTCQENLAAETTDNSTDDSVGDATNTTDNGSSGDGADGSGGRTGLLTWLEQNLKMLVGAGMTLLFVVAGIVFYMGPR